jgi:hypothetical protein
MHILCYTYQLADRFPRKDVGKPRRSIWRDQQCQPSSSHHHHTRQSPTTTNHQHTNTSAVDDAHSHNDHHHVTVVVLHTPHHHQTADVARQRACHIDGDSQDAERDPTAPDFEDHATKERGKGGKGATGGQGNKGPAAARCAMYTIDGNRAIDRVLSPPPLKPTNPLTQDKCANHAHPFTRGPNDEGRRQHRPPPMGTTTDVDGPPPIHER